MNGNLTSTVYRRVQASEASAVAPFPPRCSRSLPSLPRTLRCCCCKVAPVSSSSTLRKSEGPFLAHTTQINDPRHPAPCACLLKGISVSKQCDPRVAKAGFFFLHVVVFFLLLQSRTPPLTDLLLQRSEAQPHRHWAAFAEIFFCILRRLMARC